MLITYLDNLIGISYETNPVGYIVCCLILIWFIYEAFTLLYKILGLK